MTKTELINTIANTNLELDVINYIEGGDFSVMYADDINSMFSTPQDLLDDSTNLYTTLQSNECAWTTGSIYSSEFWTGGDKEELDKALVSKLNEFEQKDLKEAYEYILN